MGEALKLAAPYHHLATHSTTPIRTCHHVYSGSHHAYTRAASDVTYTTAAAGVTYTTAAAGVTYTTAAAGVTYTMATADATYKIHSSSGCYLLGDSQPRNSTLMDMCPCQSRGISRTWRPTTPIRSEFETDVVWSKLASNTAMAPPPPSSAVLMTYCQLVPSIDVATE